MRSATPSGCPDMGATGGYMYVHLFVHTLNCPWIAPSLYGIHEASKCFRCASLTRLTSVS